MHLSPSAGVVILGRRPVRFVLSGGLCALAQLAFLLVFTARGLAAFPANVAAFTLAAHLNFLISTTFTWGDRRSGALVTRWLAFLGAVSGTALLNLAVFEVARAALPVLLAAASGIAAAATLNYLVADRAIFTRAAATASTAPPFSPQAPSIAGAQHSWRRP